METAKVVIKDTTGFFCAKGDNPVDVFADFEQQVRSAITAPMSITYKTQTGQGLHKGFSTFQNYKHDTPKKVFKVNTRGMMR